jgi:hypothetical protein
LRSLVARTRSLGTQVLGTQVLGTQVSVDTAAIDLRHRIEGFLQSVAV